MLLPDRAVLQMTGGSCAACGSLPLAERHDGVPRSPAGCQFRYVIAKIYADVPSALHAAERQYGRSGIRSRYLASVSFQGAKALDCSDMAGLDQGTVQNGDEESRRLLWQLRMGGADLLVIRGLWCPTVVVVFTAALGRTIHLEDEADYTLHGKGRWVRERCEPPSPGPGSWRSTMKGRTDAHNGRPGARAVGWQMATGVGCSMIVSVSLRVADTSVTIPVWSALLMAFGAGVVLQVGRRDPVIER
ncbi:hypothetical protein [Conexibacter woesei]|uniref:hypothetical protein n=1 Tax=Conexibacter woesei TaxID=191495 RepID=UPI0005A2B246|nr:hypothetical protein [Conexibacter woesei]